MGGLFVGNRGRGVVGVCVGCLWRIEDGGVGGLLVENGGRRGWVIRGE